MESSELNLVATIMAGGTGTRFWPMSTKARPKQFLKLFGDRSLLQKSYDRIRDLLPVERILESAENYPCVKVAAHPFGYFGINRGVLKCIDNRTLPPGIIDHLDGIEVICGAMGRSINEKAARYAGEHGLPITGGSDAHVIPSVGGVVTCVRADTIDGFLDGILSRESIVIGSTAHPIHKGMAAGVIAWNYIPSAVFSLQVHYEENIPRMKQYLRDLLR